MKFIKVQIKRDSMDVLNLVINTNKTTDYLLLIHQVLSKRLNNFHLDASNNSKKLSEFLKPRPVREMSYSFPWYEDEVFITFLQF